MNLKLIGAVILVVLVSVGYPKYKSMQKEDEIRAFLKSQTFTEQVKTQSQPMARLMSFELDMLNHYPNIMIYQTYPFVASSAPKMISDVEKVLKKQMCQTQNMIAKSDLSEKDRKAFINVLNKDNVTFHLIIKDKYGKELLNVSQTLSKCDELGSSSTDLPKDLWKQSSESNVASAVDAPVAEAAAALP